MVKHLHDWSFSDGACFEVFHTIFSCKINCLDFGDRIANLLFFDCATYRLLLLLHNVDLVANQYLDRDFTWSLALCNPLFDVLKSWPFGHIKQINNRCGTINILVHVFVMSFFPWHVKINYLILVSIINVKGGLYKLNRYVCTVSYLPWYGARCSLRFRRRCRVSGKWHPRRWSYQLLSRRPEQS